MNLEIILDFYDKDTQVLAGTGPLGARTVTPLDALRDDYTAYTALADTGDLAEHNANSDDDVKEILQARRLVHQISTALDERMGQKIKGNRN